MIGEDIYNFIKQIYPITRSITGDGVRETFEHIKHTIPEINIHEIPSGTEVFDWTIPDEWNIRQAFIEDEDGNGIVNFEDNNLHVVNYSRPVAEVLTLEELNEHLYSIPDKPSAIPYVTSYYNDRWGFCMTHEQRLSLRDCKYRVFIDSDIKPGSLTYGELIIPGESDKEILISTYTCHPSMGNNECSGIGVTVFLAKWLMSLKERRHTYRIVFVPETIGSIAYISKNLKQLKENTIAGFVVTCIGDDNNYSYMPSRNGDTLPDKVAMHVLNNFVESYDTYSFLQRGSDERQYCHPAVNLPVVSVMRSKYGTYPEYHTSLDNLDYISPAGLQGGYDILQKCLMALEANAVYKNILPCEPKMSKRNLHPKEWHMRHLGNREDLKKQVTDMMNTMVYCDGNLDIIEISNKIGIDFKTCAKNVETLLREGILEKIR
jgi:aminopeptidase-like protein